jgi:hypothetical protein
VPASAWPTGHHKADGDGDVPGLDERLLARVVE